MDLFGPKSEDIRLPGAELKYLYPVFDEGEARSILQSLVEQTHWRRERVRVWGKEIEQPRLTAWFGDAGRSYSYSGLQLEPAPWTPLLTQIRRKIEQLSGGEYNSVLLNLYRDENDSLGEHSDDERELGDKPTIASLSVGAERTMRFRPKPTAPAGAKPVSVLLQSGSLLIMKGDTQRHWKHGIAKSTRRLDQRLNLTFRNIKDGPAASRINPRPSSAPR